MKKPGRYLNTHNFKVLKNFTNLCRNAETSKVFEKLNSNRILLNKIKTVLEENTINTLGKVNTIKIQVAHKH